MTKTTTELSFSLLPIAAAPAPAADNWLDNSNPELLNLANTENTDNNLDQVMSQLQQEKPASNYTITELKVTLIDETFYLNTANTRFALKDGDVLDLNQQLFTFHYQKETIISEVEDKEDKLAQYLDDDIWAQAPQAKQPAEINIPVSPAPQAVQRDPLDFLYNDSDYRTPPQAPRMPTPPYQQSAMPEPPYQPAQNLPAQNPAFAMRSQGSAQGNILQELGIASDQSQLVQRPAHLPATQHYPEQAPMDLLDEYLGDDLPVAAAKPRYPQAYHQAEPDYYDDGWEVAQPKRSFFSNLKRAFRPVP